MKRNGFSFLGGVEEQQKRSTGDECFVFQNYFLQSPLHWWNGFDDIKRANYNLNKLASLFKGFAARFDSLHKIHVQLQ